MSSLPAAERAAWLNKRTDVECALLQYDWRNFWARPSQLPPPGDWRTWLILSGRGWGKTRVGAEWVRESVRQFELVNMIAATADDARDIMIQGESGILRICPDDERPIYKSSQRRLEWPNGAKSLIFTADEPERLRGKQHMRLWCDEAAAWRYPEAWDQAMMGLRLGSDPRVVVTTTPRPVRIVRELMASPTTVITRGSTFDNADNLAPAFMQQIISRYENTRLGQQELLGMVLDDTPGSLWNRNQIVYRDARVASMQRIVVAIDPAVTSDPEKSDETGIIVAGRGIDGNAYIFEDLSCILSPEGWAGRAVNAYREFGADRIVAEVNNGGDLVEMVIRTHDRSVSYKAVHASRGKRVRAEPIAALYEQGKVFHTKAFPTLEDQQCAFVPDNYDGSPDRVDALVWALTELMLSPGRPFTVAVGAARNEAIWNYKPR